MENEAKQAANTVARNKTQKSKSKVTDAINLIHARSAAAAPATVAAAVAAARTLETVSRVVIGFLCNLLRRIDLMQPKFGGDIVGVSRRDADRSSIIIIGEK